jgi:hypothetical protein
MAWQVLQAGFLPQPLGINRRVIPGNTEANTWETLFEDRLRVTVTPAIPTRVLRRHVQLGQAALRLPARHVGARAGRLLLAGDEPAAQARA